MSLRSGLRLALAAVLGGAVTLLVLRQVSLGRVVAEVRQAPLPLLLLGCAGALAFNMVRAVRYRVLLGAADAPRGLLMFAISTTAWAASLALPGIVGDSFLVWLTRRHSGVTVTRGASAVLLSRAADVGSFILVVVLIAPVVGVRLPSGGLAALAGVGAMATMSVIAMWWRRPRAVVLRLTMNVPWVGARLAGVDGELSAMTGRLQAAGLLGTTLLARLCSVVEYTALFTAIGAPLGPLRTAFAVSARTLLFALPVQGLGGLGTTQLWWSAGLVLLGWHVSAALTASLAVHLLDLGVSLPVAVIGIAMLVALPRLQRCRESTRGERLASVRPRCGLWLVPAFALMAVLRVPSFYEPHWYTDEAGYVSTARALLGHAVLYTGAWTNKPPLHILAVAAVVRVLGTSEAALHTLTLATGFAALTALAFAARRLSSTRVAMAVTVAYALAIGLPLFDAQLVVPESLLIGATTWAGALVVTRPATFAEARGWWSRWGWAAVAGGLAGVGIGIQQTAVADAGGLGLAILVCGPSGWRKLLIFTAALLAVVAAWLGAVIAAAGLPAVLFSLVTFYVGYIQYSAPRSGIEIALRLLGPLLGVAGFLVLGRADRRAMAPWLWATATLTVAALANRNYPHFLAPAVAPVLLAATTLPRVRASFRARLVPLLAGALITGVFASVASTEWGIVRLYGAWPVAAVSGQNRAWAAAFDARAEEDADVATWITSHGLSQGNGVVWSSDAWIYLLADVRVQLPAAPIYNDVVLLGSSQAVATDVDSVDPDFIVTSEDATASWPEIQTLLDSRYRLAYVSGHSRIYVRSGTFVGVGLGDAVGPPPLPT